MKNLLGLLLGLILLSNLNAQALPWEVNAQEACGNNSADASVTAVAANASKYYRIFAIYLNSDSADEVAIKIGSTTKFGAFLAANGGVVHNLYPLYAENGTDNEAIVITKAGATDLHYCVWYETK
jgi:hypothetical protein